MTEYIKKPGSSGVSKAALATAIGAGAVALTNNSGGGLFGGLLGGGRPPVPFAAASDYGYVTEKELGLVREISGKDAVIARLESEKYTDATMANYATTIVMPLMQRVCDLETAAAVNRQADSDFRRYANAEFVHQPKASIRDSIVVCHNCGCECKC